MNTINNKKCDGCVYLTKWYGYFYCKQYRDYTRNLKHCNHRKEKDK